MALRLSSQIDVAIQTFRESMRRSERDDDEYDEEEDESSAHKTSVRSMETICSVIREAYSLDLPQEDLAALIDKASRAENDILTWAYISSESGEGHDFFPIYSGNVIKDMSAGAIPFGQAQKFLNMFFQMMGKELPGNADDLMREKLGSGPKAYDHSLRPSAAHTTPLARFKNRPVSLPNADAATLALREARCEIQSDRITNPIQLAVGAGVLAVQGAGGYKDREPVLQVWKLGMSSDEWADSLGDPTVDTGHLDIATQLAIDSSRGLIWTADEHRIKSISCEWNGRKHSTEAVHTFKSKGFEGPIALLNDGARLLRVGKKSIAVWDVNSAPTHDDSSLIGGKLSSAAMENSWRDSDGLDEVERSKGSAHTSTITFSTDTPLATQQIGTWTSHPSHPNTSMICATSASSNHYGVFQLDLETGKRPARYLGHGADVTSFSTTKADNNVFLTSCNDGGTRLYDVRTAVPSLTLVSAEEQMSSSILVNSGGSTYVFAGGGRSEQIKLWDLRARAALYELATGNNMVNSLAWDEPNTTLYASTECLAEDRMGYRHDYRRAKIPKWARFPPTTPGAATTTRAGPETDAGEDNEEEDEEMLDVDEDDEYDDSDDDEAPGWPENANHDETSFGYAFDAGNHSLLRYAFKSDANVTVLPVYGDATAGEDRRGYGGFGW